MDKPFDVGIIGAGIGGACLAILLAQKGYTVVVFEKDEFPRHKVCGEYISMESWNLFKKLGVPLDDWNLPKINSLKLTSLNGFELKTDLTPGGFGVSRYLLDFTLMKLMKENGVDVREKTKVENAQNGVITTRIDSINCKLIVGTFGKYRPFGLKKNSTKSAKNYVGVKYHVKVEKGIKFPENQIALHSFDGGYCGFSKVEQNTFCLCYLADSKQLKANNNSIEALENNVLRKNIFLNTIFNQTKSVYPKPKVISNIAFDKQATFSKPDQRLYIGDAAGSISPLSGNGMSMAARSAFALSLLIEQHGLNFNKLTEPYEHFWNDTIGGRVKIAKTLNTIMLTPFLNNITLRLMHNQKWLNRKIIGSMNGEDILTSTKTPFTS